MHRIDTTVLDALTAEAAGSERRRKNRNLHSAYEDPIQRLCNAVEPGTYIRPHRHETGRWELFTVLRGAVRLLTFEDDGRVATVDVLGPDRDTRLVEIPDNTWHTVAALETGTVFFEVKPGPYVPLTDKGFAAWAPPEGAPTAPAMEAWFRTAVVGARPPGEGTA